MSVDNNISLSSCVNCGKGEEASGHLKKCGTCEMVKYCNAECQEAHCSQHKQECSVRAAELHDEALFKQPPPREDCPICFLLLPTLVSGRSYQACCGKFICIGCIHAITMTFGNDMCPFCRTPTPTSDEEMLIEMTRKRMEFNDATAIYNLGSHYAGGRYGLLQDMDNALELWHQAGELGFAGAYCNIGYAYSNGEGVERDMNKARYYYELAAMGGR